MKTTNPPRQVKRPRLRGRIRPAALILGLAVGAALSVVLVALAQDPVHGEKRVPVSDSPGPAFADKAPPVETLAPVDAVTRHGDMEVYPPGKFPSGQVAALQWPEREGWKFSRRTVKDVAALPRGPVTVSPKPPAGYSITEAVVTVGVDAAGIERVVELRQRFDDGVHVPIDVTIWESIELANGLPYALTAFDEGAAVVTTLGAVAGRPAVFVHSKPGTMGFVLQEVWFTSGVVVISVESSLQDFDTILAVADSIAEVVP